MWQVVEIGWTKPKEASADWDDAKIKAAIAGHSLDNL